MNSSQSAHTLSPCFWIFLWILSHKMLSHSRAIHWKLQSLLIFHFSMNPGCYLETDACSRRLSQCCENLCCLLMTSESSFPLVLLPLCVVPFCLRHGPHHTVCDWLTCNAAVLLMSKLVLFWFHRSPCSTTCPVTVCLSVSFQLEAEFASGNNLSCLEFEEAVIRLCLFWGWGGLLHCLHTHTPCWESPQQSDDCCTETHYYYSVLFMHSSESLSFWFFRGSLPSLYFTFFFSFFLHSTYSTFLAHAGNFWQRCHAYVEGRGSHRACDTPN